jgi:DnaJ family protein C protein 27
LADPPPPQFVPKYVVTIGVDYGVKPVEVRGAPVRVNFWDLSGHGELRDVRVEFYKDAQGALLVFDVTNAASFRNLRTWLAEAREFGVTLGGAGGLPTVLLGNKADVKEARRVETRDAAAWAAENGMKYFETSAATGLGVAEAFDSLFEATVAAVAAAAGAAPAAAGPRR